MAALIQFASGAPGIKYDIKQRRLVIGRGTLDTDICLPCAFVSKSHAVIEVVDALIDDQAYVYYLEDLGSTNKTYVNNKPVTRVRLEDGDIIRIGKTTLKFDASGVTPVLDAIEVDFELPPQNQSGTWNFSRRLSLLGVD